MTKSDEAGPLRGGLTYCFSTRGDANEQEACINDKGVTFRTIRNKK